MELLTKQRKSEDMQMSSGLCQSLGLHFCSQSYNSNSTVKKKKKFNFAEDDVIFIMQSVMNPNL